MGRIQETNQLHVQFDGVSTIIKKMIIIVTNFGIKRHAKCISLISSRKVNKMKQAEKSSLATTQPD